MQGGGLGGGFPFAGAAAAPGTGFGGPPAAPQAAAPAASLADLKIKYASEIQ